MKPESVLVLIPAFNEEKNIARVVKEVRESLPDWPLVVADDGSEDGTAPTARGAGAQVISLPVHLGLGGCVQAGYKLAFELGYEYVIRIDGDGQHDPADIPVVLEALKKTQCEMVIGSRFIEGNGTRPTVARGLGIRFFRLMLRPILGRSVTDPTSGFVGVNRKALALFSKSFPLEYPEIEALVVLQRRSFRFEEVSMPHATQDERAQHHPLMEGVEVHDPRSAGRLCERASLRRQAAVVSSEGGTSVNPLLNLLTVASLALLFVVLRSVRGRHVRVEYSVSWLGAALVLLVVSRMPRALDAAAEWIGVKDSSITFLLLVLIVFLAVFYRFSGVISDLKDMNIALAQRVAILEYQLERVRDGETGR